MSSVSEFLRGLSPSRRESFVWPSAAGFLPLFVGGVVVQMRTVFFSKVPLPLGDAIDYLWSCWFLFLFLLGLLKNEKAARGLNVFDVNENRQDHLDLGVWLYVRTKPCTSVSRIGTPA